VKLGIPILVIGILLLFVSIPLSIFLVIRGVDTLAAGDIIGGAMAYAPIVGVVLGFLFTAIGATRVFKD
jgi:hypothetical protein